MLNTNTNTYSNTYPNTWYKTKKKSLLVYVIIWIFSYTLNINKEKIANKIKINYILIKMSLTPKKKEYGSYIYKFFEEQDSLSKKYKCKSCENNIVGSVTNLRKHIKTNQWMNQKIQKKNYGIFFI